MKNIHPVVFYKVDMFNENVVLKLSFHDFCLIRCKSMNDISVVRELFSTLDWDNKKKKMLMTFSNCFQPHY